FAGKTPQAAKPETATGIGAAGRIRRSQKAHANHPGIANRLPLPLDDAASQIPPRNPLDRNEKKQGGAVFHAHRPAFNRSRSPRVIDEVDRLTSFNWLSDFRRGRIEVG